MMMMMMMILMMMMMLNIRCCYGLCPCIDDTGIEYDHYNQSNIRSLVSSSSLASSSSSSSSMTMCIMVTITRSSPTTSHAITSSLKSLTSSLDFTLHFVDMIPSSSSSSSSQCNVFIEITDSVKNDNKADYLCPGQCSPLPYITIPLNLFINDNDTVDTAVDIAKDTRITCSLTTSMVLSSLQRTSKRIKVGVGVGGRGWNTLLLKEIFWRRHMECYERMLWIKAYERYNQQRSHDRHLMHHDDGRFYRGTLNLSDSAVHNSDRGKYHFTISIERRKVRAVIVWIGSRHNLELIKQQSVTLKDEVVHGTDAVIGWAATDECFPCSPNARCRGPGNFRYKYLPGSNMKFAKEGWTCAQRRPLRALAHVLRIFDPDFAVVLDDDTFLNYKLLVQRYSFFVNPTNTRPLVMGEFRGRQGDEGHLTKLGILVGGSGYIMNRKVLESLASYKLHHFPLNRSNILNLNSSLLNRMAEGPEEVESDEYRSNLQIHYLSVVNEGMQNSMSHCSVYKNINTCTFLNRPLRVNKKAASSSRSLAYPIAIPVIEFCSNLMADSNTCQHSDHSLGRCLMYAVAADPVAAACQSIVDPWPDSINIGMCFITPSCNVSHQISCHRYKPDGDQAIRITTNRGHYKHFSSVYDGIKIDSK